MKTLPFLYCFSYNTFVSRYEKLVISVCTVNIQPSTSTNKKQLKTAMKNKTIGGSIIMPIAISVLATIISITIKGM